MHAPALTTEGGAKVEVRLSQIPFELREKVATLIVSRAGLTGEQALAFMLGAYNPRQDPTLLVTAEKAGLVLAGKLPPGETPKVWLW